MTTETNAERLAKVESLLNRYYNCEDSFEQTDLAIEIIQGHVGWLQKQAERVPVLQQKILKNQREKVWELQKENARLREAIERSIKAHRWNNEESAQILEKTLAGDSNA